MTSLYLYGSGMLGLILLVGGGDVMIRGTVATAKRLGLPTLLIAMSIVAIGTSAPELVVSLQAVFQDATGMAVGNVIGSNIANILCLLGITGLIRPMIIQRTPAMWRDSKVLIMATLAFIGIAYTTGIIFPVAIAMIGGLVGYITYSYVDAKRHPEMAEPNLEEVAAIPAMPLPKALALLVGGLVGIVVGADLFVDAAAIIAEQAGVSKTVIGLTLVAFGTSLPEIATTVIATLKGEDDVAFGTIIGSCLFNLLLILGAAGLVKSYPIEVDAIAKDLWLMLGSILLLVGLLRYASRVGRPLAAVLLLIYLGWVGQQFV